MQLRRKHSLQGGKNLPAHELNFKNSGDAHNATPLETETKHAPCSHVTVRGSIMRTARSSPKICFMSMTIQLSSLLKVLAFLTTQFTRQERVVFTLFYV
mmetsp:Transcript_21083/g.29753  ORF Transcript_21083/g.29753 Transcript_21083/m.29753 type:complete len:99 (-) Transcript_21083:55-351(-)